VAAAKFIEIGKFVGLFGVQGWVKLESYTEPRLQIFAYQPWLVELRGGERELAGVQGRAVGKGIVAKLPGIDDRDVAATLIGATIKVNREVLPKPRRGEYYWTDLEGLDVVNIEGVALGKVSHLFATGANDVLVARDGTRERLIPFVPKQYVREVDLDCGKIVVEWDENF
jgi:16S rRNA processing protein RimM